MFIVYDMMLKYIPFLDSLVEGVNMHKLTIFVVRNLKYILINFQLYNKLLLTIATILHDRSLDYIASI
jgi:hypothetical protein